MNINRFSEYFRFINNTRVRVWGWHLATFPEYVLVKENSLNFVSTQPSKYKLARFCFNVFFAFPDNPFFSFFLSLFSCSPWFNLFNFPALLNITLRLSYLLKPCRSIKNEELQCKNPSNTWRVCKSIQGILRFVIEEINFV